ncbi:HesA/MoeB/ThiF family protein [Microbacterium halophytorum]|uniref:HesA/MoeB/ThiF family protein n=1 Tax=Microbacterium halophytorum TaxID=2067568 RepID=UPI00131A3FFB|nr:ThiF family adenylyltransferase [Microbacterium halophytorum]
MTYGLGQSIRDPDAQLLELNDLLDGRRTREQIIEQICRLASVDAPAAHEFFDALVENGHIEDADARTSLTPQEQDRYSRSAHFYAWITKHREPSRWHAQEALGAASVTIAGVGGIGGAIAMHLAAAGIGALRLVDCDSVELSNLNRQYLFSEADVGARKVHVAAERLRRVNSDCEIEAIDTSIDSAQHAAELLRGADLFFRAADTPPSMPYWVSDAALAVGTPWINCSYAGPVINCCTYVPGKTGCYRCLRRAERECLVAEGRSQVISDDPPAFNAAIGPVVHAAGSLAAYEGIRLLAGLNPRTVGRAWHQNMYDYAHSYAIDVPEDCTHGS